ncbi:MAG: lytic transglycosylase domain-containing protein [Bryobacteraceae bacterium]|nr:lytic transglycosylase domain-containing protein [Bryobacteraceae bacterium]
MEICFWFAALTLATGAPGAEPTRPAERAVMSVVRADHRTGRLVRRIVAEKPRRASSRDAGVPGFVHDAAVRYNLDPLLVHALIEVESGYDPYAISPRGAEGLMQLIPGTARRLGVSNPFNFSENLLAGARHLRYLLDRFQDLRLALAAYNAGEGAVVRYGGIPPYAETRRYVEEVSRRYESARRTSAVAQALPRPDPDAPRPVRWFQDSRGVFYLRTP